MADPRLQQFVPLLTSTTVGIAVPSFKEEFGEGKKIDLVGTLSHEFFTDKITDANPTGITLDKNGMLKITFNAGAKMVIEKSAGDWVEARDFYATLQIKAKVSTNQTDPYTKHFTIAPKNLELSLFKIFKGEEEMFLEQMLLQSFVNLQIEQVRKFLKPFRFNTTRANEAKELACMGIAVSGIDIKPRKGLLQFDVTYRETTEKDNEFCEKFENTMKEGPLRAFKKISKELPEVDGLAKKLGLR